MATFNADIKLTKAAVERIKIHDLSQEFLNQSSSPLDLAILDSMDWDKKSEEPQLTEAFIEEHADRVNWKIICNHQNLSEAFIEKFKDRVDWKIISCKQKLSEVFIMKYKAKLCWSDVCAYQKLSEKFMIKMSKYIDWGIVCEVQEMSESFIIKHQGNMSWENIFIGQRLSEAFIAKYHHMHEDSLTLAGNNQLLSEKFIIEYADDMCWISISSSQPITEQFVLENLDRIRWRFLSKNCIIKYYSHSFLINNPIVWKEVWDIIAPNTMHDIEFACRYKDKLNTKPWKVRKALENADRIDAINCNDIFPPEINKCILTFIFYDQTPRFWRDIPCDA